MEKSDEYIDYQAYLRYLGKVTGEPADPDKLKRAVLDRTEEPTEMQVGLSLMKSLVTAAAIVLACVLWIAGIGYATNAKDEDAGEELWSGSRVQDKSNRGVPRLYEAYQHSKEIRDKF